MSNYMAKARDRKTGEIVDVTCFDDYFGRHRYGYRVGDATLPKEEFIEKYQFIGEMV